MKVIEYSDDYRVAWTAFVEQSASATFAHVIGWRTVIARTLRHQPRYLLAVDDNRVSGVLPLFLVTTWWRSRYLVSIPWMDYGGICADNAEAVRLLLERSNQLAKELRADFVEMRSVEIADRSLPTRDDKVTFLLELNSDPEIIWAGFGAKLRNQIRKAEKSGLTTHLGGKENLDSFYAVFCHNMRDLGTPVWGRDFFEAVLDELGNSARIILVRLNDKTIAGGLVLSFKDRMYVPSASAYREYLPLCPNHALYWRVIREACANGFGHFDFGRSAVGSNTFNFKKQWTPDPTRLNWQYQLNNIAAMPSINPSNPKYRLFINMWRHMPLSLANFMGPKIIRNFP